MGKKSSNNAAKLRDYLFNLNILPKSQMQYSACIFSGSKGTLTKTKAAGGVFNQNADHIARNF